MVKIFFISGKMYSFYKAGKTVQQKRNQSPAMTGTRKDRGYGKAENQCVIV